MATKKTLIEKIRNKLTYLSEEDANIAVDSVLEYIKDELSKKNRIEIRGLGSMSIRKKSYAGGRGYLSCSSRGSTSRLG